jgi:hypothetical protein
MNMKYLKKMYAKLLSTEISLLRYSAQAYAIAITPSFIMAMVALLIGEIFNLNIETPKKIEPTFKVFITFFAYAPLFETFVLAFLIYIINIVFKIKQILFTSILVSLIFGIIHGLNTPIQFLGTFWTFFVISIAYISWSKHGFSHAYFAALIPHSLINLTAFILLRLTH